VNTVLKQSLAIFFHLTVILLTGCNQNSDQREFERAAFSMPEGFTETGPSGQVIDRDPDDWRIAPFFQGIIEVDPAYPNPVQSNEAISIYRIVTGVESVSGFWVLAFYDANNIQFIFDDLRRPLPTGGETVTLQARDIAQFQENPQGLYRIIIMDANENVITYGDIKIE
jgi:hypothetical protein